MAGKRFESARRLSLLPAKPVKTESPDVRVAGFVSSTSAVDYPKASSLALVYFIKWLQGTAAENVSEASGVERLTDVLEFWQGRHCRISFA